jgi:hypothetical protein
MMDRNPAAPEKTVGILLLSTSLYLG